jgi:hypothetical protein
MSNQLHPNPTSGVYTCVYIALKRGSVMAEEVEKLTVLEVANAKYVEKRSLSGRLLGNLRGVGRSLFL